MFCINKFEFGAKKAKIVLKKVFWIILTWQKVIYFEPSDELHSKNVLPISEPVDRFWPVVHWQNMIDFELYRKARLIFPHMPTCKLWPSPTTKEFDPGSYSMYVNDWKTRYSVDVFLLSFLYHNVKTYIGENIGSNRLNIAHRFELCKLSHLHTPLKDRSALRYLCCHYKDLFLASI